MHIHFVRGRRFGCSCTHMSWEKDAAKPAMRAPNRKRPETTLLISRPPHASEWGLESSHGRGCTVANYDRCAVARIKMSIELLRAGSSDSRNVLASNLFAKVFESWETNFVWLLLMAMCKKLIAGLFSCMLFVLKAYFHDLFRIFGNFDVD